MFGIHTVCIDCPKAFDVRALYKAIEAIVDNIACSTLYQASGNNGLIIVQGRHVMTDPTLIEEANYSIWLDQDNMDPCAIRYLTAKRQWHMPIDATDADLEIALRQHEAAT